MPTTLTRDSYDFLELVSFAAKQETEGGFGYTWENYPPVFRDLDLQHLEGDREGFHRLLSAHREAIDAWWEEHPEDGCDLHNAHVDESRRERDRRCLWGVRHAGGNISPTDESAARFMSGNASWGFPTLLRREHADAEWVEA